MAGWHTRLEPILEDYDAEKLADNNDNPKNTDQYSTAVVEPESIGDINRTNAWIMVLTNVLEPYATRHRATENIIATINGDVPSDDTTNNAHNVRGTIYYEHPTSKLTYFVNNTTIGIDQDHGERQVHALALGLELMQRLVKDTLGPQANYMIIPHV